MSVMYAAFAVQLILWLALHATISFRERNLTDAT